jgi:hypothetical protein
VRAERDERCLDRHQPPDAQDAAGLAQARLELAGIGSTGVDVQLRLRAAQRDHLVRDEARDREGALGLEEHAAAKAPHRRNSRRLRRVRRQIEFGADVHQGYARSAELRQRQRHVLRAEEFGQTAAVGGVEHGPEAPGAPQRRPQPGA